MEDELYDLYDNDDPALDYDDDPYDEQEAYLPKSSPIQEQKKPEPEPEPDSEPESVEELRRSTPEPSPARSPDPSPEPSPSPSPERSPQPQRRSQPNEELLKQQQKQEEEKQQQLKQQQQLHKEQQQQLEQKHQQQLQQQQQQFKQQQQQQEQQLKQQEQQLKQQQQQFQQQLQQQRQQEEALQLRVKQQDAKIVDLETQLKDTQLQLDKVRNSFKDVALACGVPFTSSRDPDPVAVLDAVQQLHTVRNELQEEGKQMRKLEAALQIHMAEKNMDTIELRRELHACQQQADSSVVQLKQLLLDPAVNKEFQRLKTELQNSQRELKHVQEELEAVNFTQESKTGRLLMQKCRALQDENEEMGKELTEGKQHQLEMQLALAREFAAEMQKNYVELRDHCSVLDEEAEELQLQVISLRRQNQELEHQLGYYAPPSQNAQRMKPEGSFFERKGPPPGGPSRPFDRKRPPPPVDKDMGPRFMGRKRIR